MYSLPLPLPVVEEYGQIDGDGISLFYMEEPDIGDVSNQLSLLNC